MSLVLDQSDDHAVQVEEEQDEMEAELGEGFLGVSISFYFLQERQKIECLTFL